MDKFIATTSNMDLNQEKKRLRKEILHKIKQTDRTELLKQKEEIEEKVEKLSAYKKAKTILFYWSLPGEVDTKDLIERASNCGKRVALPVIISKKEMKPYEHKEREFLIKNNYGVQEPDKNRSAEIDINGLDMVIVPGVAFDKENKRLGRGKGYYDRFLEKLSDDVVTVGLAFPCQLVDTLPFNPLQDKKIDLVISA